MREYIVMIMYILHKKSARRFILITIPWIEEIDGFTAMAHALLKSRM